MQGLAENGSCQVYTAANGKPGMDVYFSADIETDGAIPGPFSMLSFALVPAGSYDGELFRRPPKSATRFYTELRPISENFDAEALSVNHLDRERLIREGKSPETAMTSACEWVKEVAGSGRPVLVAYPLSFDWAWLYWYFIRFSRCGSPFDHSRCFDMKTAFAVKSKLPVSEAGKSRLFPWLRGTTQHTHHALDDAIEQAEIFARLFEWGGTNGRSDQPSSSGNYQAD